VQKGCFQLLLQGFMTVPAELLFFLYQQMLICSGMCMMTVRTHTLLESSMNISFAQKIFNPFMTTKTEGIHVLFYQILEITCMHIMTGFTLSLFEREMHVTLGKFLLEFFMTLITKFRNFTLDTCLSIAEITPT
jgi:hypothetical protein